MRITKFNVLFPLLFLICDVIVLYFVTLLMHYLTFSEWTFHNNLIMIAWVMIVIYNKSYNIGRGVSYLVTLENALKSIFVLLALISFANLFFNVYEFSIINLLTGILIFTFSVIIYRLMVHGLLDIYRTYGGNIKNIAIIGYDKKGINLYNTILNNPHLGYRSKGVFYKKSKSKYDIPYMGKISDFINGIENYSEAYISDEIPNKVKKRNYTRV